MISEVMDTHSMNDSEPSTAPTSTAEQPSPVFPQSNPLCREISLPALAAQCLQEIDAYRRGEPSTESSSVALLRCATVEDDQEAWLWVQHCFGGLVRGWLRRHPRRVAACRLESDEYYVAQAFERFWQATASKQRLEFTRLAAALRYLRASLHGAILDTLRRYARPREVSLPGPGEPGEPQAEDSTESSDVWEVLQTMLSNPREQRVAYLLFHCGLKPREIVRLCPQEWSSTGEIYGLRRTIMERLLRNADHLRWRLS
jgi:DNA-directed RNA polymerase specialized sigma24 family protein